MIIPKKWIKMLTKEWKVIEVFEIKPWEKYTFKEVKKLSKNKSDNYVHGVLKKFTKLSVLSADRYGNSIVYSLDHSQNAIKIISFISEYKGSLLNVPHELIIELMDVIPTSFFSFVITGSYAEQKQTKKSDIDIVVLCDNSKNPKEVLVPLKNKGELSIPKVHPYVFTERQFYEMLVNKEENYGKEVARKRIIVYGAESFYRILFNAIEHGFKG